MSAPLAKGQKGPLAIGDVLISVHLTAAADLSALLVTEQGRVRSEADLCCDHAVQPLQSGWTDAVELALRLSFSTSPAVAACVLSHVRWTLFRRNHNGFGVVRLINGCSSLARAALRTVAAAPWMLDRPVV